jgi:Icc-related predicted phosphoesterase
MSGFSSKSSKNSSLWNDGILEEYIRGLMKFLFTSDLHGNIDLYQELLTLAISSSSEVLALGGDLLPSFSPTKRYEDMIPYQKTFIYEFLSPLFKRMIENSPVKRILLIPGNWDLGYPYLFAEPREEIVDLDQSNFRLNNGYELIGYPFVPPTPFRPKDYEKMDDPEASWPPQKDPSYMRSPGSPDRLVPIDPYSYLNQKGTIQEDLDRLPRPLDPKRVIYIMHSPPFGTKLDLIQGGRSAGSRSIRTFIEKNQFLLTLHGHIHESPQISGTFADAIGETVVVNPGQSTSSTLHAVTFELENLSSLEHTCFGKVRSS